MKKPIPVTAIHLRTTGGEDPLKMGLVISVEVNGKWFDVIKERLPGAIGHIVEAPAIQKAIDAYYSPTP